MTTRSRAWTFTVNNPSFEDIIRLLDSNSWQYLFIGVEHGGKTGTEHLQGYIYFNDAKTMKSVKHKYLPRAHLEVAKGTLKQNQTYCSKEGEFYEFGNPPQQGAASFDRIENAMKNPKENFHLYQQYQKTYKQLSREELLVNRLDNKRHVKIIWSYELYEYSPVETLVLRGYGFENLPYNMEKYVAFAESARHGLHKMVKDWYHGFFPTIHRGYEIFKFCPEVILIVVDNANEAKSYKKLFKPYLYRCHRHVEKLTDEELADLMW